MQIDDPQYYIEGTLNKDRRILSRTLTLVESSLKRHRVLARQVIGGLLPHSGNSVRVGVTGVPGAGKSTFIENLGVMLADRGHKVAVMAVDPSSRQVGGSILGDKTRMGKLAFHENAFVRPSPSGETLGGVAKKTRECMLVCEAAGYDVILVETVGVGQSEISVGTMVDFFLTLMIAGAGDELQGIKKGVLEVSDALVINKADGTNRKRAMQAGKELEQAMKMVVTERNDWFPPVLICSSIEKDGTLEVWQTILAHQETMKKSGAFEQKRRAQAVEWMWALVHTGLKTRFREEESLTARIPDLSAQVNDGRISPSTAADELLALFYKSVAGREKSS
jgi:LAO/AO transport system kinase